MKGEERTNERCPKYSERINRTHPRERESVPCNCFIPTSSNSAAARAIANPNTEPDSAMTQGKQPAELKKGALLKYKKRIFKSNWRESQVSLYSNATLVSRTMKSTSDCKTSTPTSETKIRMTNQTTLIIFGRQLKDVPKKPILPTGYRMEQLLAIGLIYSASEKSIEEGSERMTIVFHWFLSPSLSELFEWIVAINNSIPNKQIITNDELTMSLVMAEATYFNQLMMLHDTIDHQQALASAETAADANADQSQGHSDITYVNSSHIALDPSEYFYDNYYSDTTANADPSNYFCAGEFDTDCSAFAAADAFAVF